MKSISQLKKEKCKCEHYFFYCRVRTVAHRLSTFSVQKDNLVRQELEEALKLGRKDRIEKALKKFESQDMKDDGKLAKRAKEFLKMLELKSSQCTQYSLLSIRHGRFLQ